MNLKMIITMGYGIFNDLIDYSGGSWYSQWNCDIHNNGGVYTLLVQVQN